MYRQRPPRVEEAGATYFATFVLLDRQLCDLTERVCATLIIRALRHFDGERYLLFDYVVMPENVHLILMPLKQGDCHEPLSKIYHSLKGFTAHEINKLLQRTGAVWEDGTRDHVLRNRQDYEEKARYIFMNPVAAELVGDPAKWPWWGKGSGTVR